MASDYLPGVYTRIGTEENPGTFREGSGSGISNSMPPITVKPWVLKNDKWNMRGYWISGGIFNIPPVWLMDNEGEERISGFRVPEGFGCSESRFDWYLSGLCT